MNYKAFGELHEVFFVIQTFAEFHGTQDIF